MPFCRCCTVWFVQNQVETCPLVDILPKLAASCFSAHKKCNGTAAPTLIFLPYSASVTSCTSSSSRSEVFKGHHCHSSEYAPYDAPQWSSTRWMHKTSKSKLKLYISICAFQIFLSVRTDSALLDPLCLLLGCQLSHRVVKHKERFQSSLARSLFGITWGPSHVKKNLRRQSGSVIHEFPCFCFFCVWFAHTCAPQTVACMLECALLLLPGC